MNTVKVGAYISKLRKRENLTQSELARKLNITHQAISKWENGTSMPDVAILLDLAEILNVKVENILKGEDSKVEVHEKMEIPETPEISEITDEFVTDKIIHVHGPGKIDQIKDRVNIIKEEVEDIITNSVRDNECLEDKEDKVKDKIKIKTKNKVKIKTKKLLEMAPFIETDKIDLLIDHAYGDETVERDMILSLAPFASGEKLASMIERSVEGEIDFKTVASLAPFLEEEKLESIIDKLMQNDKVDFRILESLVPFISSKKIKVLYMSLEDKEEFAEHASRILPFLEEEDTSEILNKYIEDITSV